MIALNVELLSRLSLDVVMMGDRYVRRQMMFCWCEICGGEDRMVVCERTNDVHSTWLRVSNWRARISGKGELAIE
jgi:hypothetical protein